MTYSNRVSRAPQRYNDLNKSTSGRWRRPLGLLEFLVYVLIAIVTLALLDSNAFEGSYTESFLTRQIGFFSAPDALVCVILLVLFASSDSRLLFTRTPLKIIVPITCLLLVTGVVVGRAGVFRVGGTLGPETRGLFIWMGCLAACTYCAWHYDLFPARALGVWGLFLVLHSFYEYFAPGQVEAAVSSRIRDEGHLISCAVFAVLMLAYWYLAAAAKARYQIWAAVFYFFFSAIIALGYRRTPILIWLGGHLLVLCLAALRTRQLFAIARVVAVGSVTVAVLMSADSLFFGGDYAQRVLSTFDVTTGEGTSNFEHLGDLEDALRIVRLHPLIGAGTATIIPDRQLDVYGEMIPFHSPHLHTWIRLSVFGLLAYLAFQFFVLRESFAVALHKGSAEVWAGAAGMAVSSYMLFQVAMPPFYLDAKQSVAVGLLFGIVLGRRIRNPELGARKRRLVQY